MVDVWWRSFYIEFVGVVWGSELIFEVGGGLKFERLVSFRLFCSCCVFMRFLLRCCWMEDYLY